MDLKHENQLKRTRVRLKPYKKWAVAEEKALIQFLLNNRDIIEKPSAQVFYRRFCNENNLKIEWKTVRTKVKNMRNSFFTAKAFESGSLDILNKGQIDSKVLKKCSYYHELKGVFGHQILELSRRDDSLESESSNLLTSIVIDSDDTSQRPFEDYFPSSAKTPQPELMEIQPDLFNSKHLKLHTDLNKKCEELGVNAKELSFDNKLKVMELILKDKGLALKERQLNCKEKIKMHEINSQEKLKILELEMKERLAREELKLKYK